MNDKCRTCGMYVAAEDLSPQWGVCTDCRGRAMNTEHDNGLHHGGPVDGCPACEADVAALPADSDDRLFRVGHEVLRGTWQVDTPGTMGLMVDGLQVAAVRTVPGPGADGRSYDVATRVARLATFDDRDVAVRWAERFGRRWLADNA